MKTIHLERENRTIIMFLSPITEIIQSLDRKILDTCAAIPALLYRVYLLIRYNTKNHTYT